jgi:rSAM/selenodomain-associated transferase 2
VRLSIIIPVHNEASAIAGALTACRPLRERGAEIVVVDGGSTDSTRAIAAGAADHMLTAPRGRALQQNAGAQQASGDVLLFLHSDTQLPPGADTLIEGALVTSGAQWGRFDVRFDASQPMLRSVAAMMNARSRLTGIATGDQCIFVRRDAFAAVGGFPTIELMEDIELSKRLRRLSKPACLHATVTTSARRWVTNGIWRTIVLMLSLRLAHFFGVSPTRLAKWYGYR